jgi:hypothetical protein
LEDITNRHLRRMTTKTSEIDLLKPFERQLPMNMCACHGRLMLMQRETDDGLVLSRYPACRKCADIEVAQGEGWIVPAKHPKMPRLFWSTDESKLHPRMKEALQWKPTLEKSGLLLHGTTGIGKSRAAWEWVNREWLRGVEKDINLPFIFLTMSELEDRIQGSFTDKNHGDVLRELCETPLLALDDLGKERLTPRMASDLFALLDKRSLKSHVTIITTNFNGQGLIDRFQPQDKETGVALVRRLRDYYTPYGMQDSHQ